MPRTNFGRRLKSRLEHPLKRLLDDDLIRRDGDRYRLTEKLADDSISGATGPSRRFVRQVCGDLAREAEQAAVARNMHERLRFASAQGEQMASMESPIEQQREITRG